MKKLVLATFLFVSNCLADDLFGYDAAEKAMHSLKQEEYFEQEQYKRYFGMQEDIYKGLEQLGMPGARRLNVDVNLAESVLANCPSEVQEVISDIQHRVFVKNKKNILFHGPSGTGKSALAQAIAIKCRALCLFFNVGTISTTYMNSGVQNLSKIFEYADELAKQVGMPCIVILDELESLTKKHAASDNPENNILISFWQELDKLCNSQVIVIGTMNSVDDVPEQIINRTCMIEVPLPTQKQREAILSYYLENMQNQYKLRYPVWLDSAYLARQTYGFSNRDLENVVTIALRSAMRASVRSNGSDSIVSQDDFYSAIKQIRQDFINKRKRIVKKYLLDSKIVLPVIGLVFTVVGICIQMMIANKQMHQAQINTNMQMDQSLKIANMQMNQSQAIANQQMCQARTIADQQISIEHLAKTAAINTACSNVFDVIVRSLF